MATSKELERKAERTRERLSDRLSDLRDHVSPRAMIGDLLDIDPEGLANDLAPTLVKQARSNPVAFGLIAAGVGWLVFSEIREPLARLAYGTYARRRSRSAGPKRRRTKR